MAINSTQIAKLAGVSRSTVSKVLHNYKGIPEETKQKVLQVVKEYDYRPNTMSQALRGICPKVIGVYFYEELTYSYLLKQELLFSHYNMALLNSIAIEAKKFGYTVVYELLYSTESDQAIASKINEAFDARKISCAAFVGLTDKAHFVAQIAKPERHIILLDKEEDTTSGVRCLFSNDFRSAELACEHLWKNGFTRLMHISGEQIKRSGVDRKEGYLSFMRKLKAHGQDTCEPCVILGSFSVENGYAAGERFIKEKLYETYNGVLCGCDMVAIGFLKYMRENAPQLVDHLGIIGFDNELVDQYFTPSLSTMAPNYRSFAHMIFDLEQNYEEFKGGMSLKLDHELIERDSSRPLARRNYKWIPTTAPVSMMANPLNTATSATTATTAKAAAATTATTAAATTALVDSGA